ncbi:MAG: hypothetical protein SFX74_08965 [Fimbriimonadaceae bacterium]|nr:hypothetical protein [Fimbriimonadaceae bacterium]
MRSDPYAPHRFAVRPVAWIALSLLLTAGALGQTATPNLFDTVRAEVTLVIREHTGGADVVEVKVLDPNYDPARLQAEINQLGEDLRSKPRAVRIYEQKFGTRPQDKFLEATFAVDGLLEKDRLRLAPIARSFGAAPTRGLAVVTENYRPTDDAVMYFRDERVELQGMALPGSIGLEYRIRILTDRPETIEIPETARQVSKKTPARRTNSEPQVLLWSVLGVAGLAAGLLVYSLLLRSRGNRARR